MEAIENINWPDCSVINHGIRFSVPSFIDFIVVVVSHLWDLLIARLVLKISVEHRKAFAVFQLTSLGVY